MDEFESKKKDTTANLISEALESKGNSSSVTIGYFSKINCNILKSGITPMFDEYYLCECDPERRNAICAECFKICHNGPGHKEIKKFLRSKVCMCGYKCHQPMDEKDEQIQQYSKKCLFGSLGLKYFYTEKSIPDSHICIFCKNLCFENAKTLVRLKDNKNSENENNDCNCTDHNHNDIRILFRKLRGLTKKNNFIEKYDFEGLTFVHVINLLFRENICFNNLFYSFSTDLNEIISKIKEDSFYTMEDYKFINNFHLTCRILSSFAEKNMNIYSLLYFMPEETKYINPNNLSFISGKNQSLQATSMNMTTSAANRTANNFENFENVYLTKIRALLYYRDEIGDILTIPKYFQIMYLKFDFKSRNIWQLKVSLTNIFYSFKIKKLFLPTINYKIKDMLLLTPLQRLTVVSTSKKKIESCQDKSLNILDATINLLIKIEKTKERQNEVFCIYNVLYKICQNYAKFGFFTHIQVPRFCTVNNKILLTITENLTEDKKSQAKKNIIFKVLSPMMKTLLFLCYHFNDQMFISYLKKEKNLNSVNFFHMKNEICKLLMNNAIYALSIIQELVPDIFIENYKNDDDDSASFDEGVKKKKGKMKTGVMKFQINNHYYEDANIERCIRNATFAAHSIIRIILDLPDNYQSSLTRLLNSDAEILFNYLNGGVEYMKDGQLISKFQRICEDLEEAYLLSFDTFENFNEQLVNNMNQNVDKVLDMINEVKVIEVDNIDLYKNNTNNNVMQDDIFNYNRKKKFNILLNFSPLIQILFKGIHILYYFNTCKRAKTFFTSKKVVGSNDLYTQQFVLDEKLCQKILKICNFYVSDDINNCFMFLTSDILSIIELLSTPQLDEFLIIIEKCLIKIRDTSEELTSNSNLIHLIKMCMGKVLGNLNLIYKLLKIISLTLQLNFGNEQNTLKKLKKMFIASYDVFKDSQVDLHSLLIEKDKEEIYDNNKKEDNSSAKGDLVIVENDIKVEEKNKNNGAEDIVENNSADDENNELIKNNDDKKKQSEKLLKLKDKITHKILWILNCLFEGNTSVDEKSFLECLLSKTEIKAILSKDFTIDIGIRTELLIFYRIVYLDTVLIKNNINYYTSLLINDPIIQKTEAIVENQKLLRFYQNLILSGTTKNIENITEDADVIKFELLNYKGIIESLAKNNNTKKTRNYIELGIMKPLMVYLSKFSGVVFNCSGYDYLRYFELLYHFLFFKKYILEHPLIFYDGEDEEMDNGENNMEKDKNFFTKKNKNYRNPFRNKLNSLCKHRKKIIVCDFDANELKKLKAEIEKLLKLNFEVLNFSSMNNIFELSFEGFIQKEGLNKGMKDYFEKSDIIYDEKSLEKIKKYLQNYNLYNTEFQQDIFEVIIHYINGKAQLEDCSFIKMLSEDNMFYNCKWRVLLIKNILFFMMNNKFENTYKEMCLWELFRLLEYDTRETQKACLELMEKKDNPVNFEYFLQNITYNIMNVLIKDLNPGCGYIRFNYYMTLMIIKILKYFCEEHNQDFQRIFFIKEDDGIILHYNPHQYDQKNEEENITFNEQSEKFKNSLIMDSDTIIDNSKENIGDNGNENIQNKKPVPDIECEDLHEITRSEDNNAEVQKNKASVFEFMLSILGKIILLSGWNNSKSGKNLDDYLYDLYFVILEFLIETIQGTRYENLQTVFKKDQNGKHLFGTFLNDIHRLIHEDNEEELSYQVRKDMMDFLMAFLEESATPPAGIIEISTVILPITILENIVNTMSKLYDSIKEEETENFNNENTKKENTINNNLHDEINSPENNLLENKLENCATNNLFYKKKITTGLNNISTRNDSNASPLFMSNFMNNIKGAGTNSQGNFEDNPELNKKLNHRFTPKMKKFFNDKYFNDTDFGEDIRFGLANRMYQFFKFFGIVEEYCNPAVSEFYEKMSWYTEKNIIKSYYYSRSSPNFTLVDNNNHEIDKSKEKSTTITDPNFYDNYLCVSFFESITRMVFVNKPGVEKPVRVLFTINPVVPLLSNVSKNDFFENVDRSDRYSKLFSLMESCDYFFEEVSYKQNQAKNNFIAKLITDLDFYWIEVIAFFINFTINIILLATVEGEGERLYGDENTSQVVDILGFINFIFNLLAILMWIFVKFPLYYLTESHKHLKKKIKEREDKNDDDEEIELNLFDKIYVTYYILFKKSILVGFIWNLIFSCAGFFSKIYFFYIVQLFAIVNLSQTLRNLILSLTIKLNQLSAVFYCTLVFNLLFGNIAFFKFSRDFIREIDSSIPYNYDEELDFLYDLIGTPYEEPAHVESECGTMLYCFATHLSYGMRFDGGIADRMEKASFTHEKGYYLARFFYEEFYFIILVILMLNMIYGIIIEAFSELRNKEQKINRDKTEVCFICGIDKESCEKKGEKLEEHLTHVHNLWTYVEYMIGLRFVDIQDTNAINSYVIENLEQKELVWFPYDETAMAGEENQGEDEE